jgi:hypothetical protein
VTPVVELYELAVMVTFWLVVTLPAAVVKMAEATPAGTSTNVGIISSELSAVNCTVRGLESVRLNWTVQMLEVPEINAVGLQLRGRFGYHENRTAGRRVLNRTSGSR